MRLLHIIHLLDLRTFDWCLRRRHRQLFVDCSRWISRSADGHFYILSFIVATATQQWLLSGIIAAGFSLERPLYFALKNQLRRHRPQQIIAGYRSVVEPADQFSFPSGHTSAAFLFAGIVSAFFPAASPLILCWAIAVGLSRIILGVHFPTDTVAGAFMGYAISQLCLHIAGLG